MSAAPETKYTDRDVRGNPDLVEMAVEYVEAYDGEFEYLIDMKMRLAQNYDLTTPMIRGILNCMRHDPRVTGLPTPVPPEEGTVIELRQPKRARRRRHGLDKENPVSCQKTTSHDAHVWWKDDDSEWCEGIPWEITRTRYPHYPAVVKAPFVVARQGNLIHRVADKGHYFYWRQETHEWGFWRMPGEDFDDPELWVNLVCRFPSILKRPILLDQERAEKMIEVCELRWCPHCGG